jgi:hypothetical protein
MRDDRRALCARIGRLDRFGRFGTIASPSWSRPIRVIREAYKMPRTKLGGKSGVKVKVGASAPAATISREQELEQEIARLRGQLEAKSTSNAGRVYAPAQTPREVADEIAGNPEMLRDIMDLCVKRIPGSPVTASEPYGQPVLITLKSGVRANAMKDNVDRGDYIKLRNLLHQIVGDFVQRRQPKALTDEQIDKVLRPTLDSLNAAGLVSWE